MTKHMMILPPEEEEEEEEENNRRPTQFATVFVLVAEFLGEPGELSNALVTSYSVLSKCLKSKTVCDHTLPKMLVAAIVGAARMPQLPLKEVLAVLDELNPSWSENSRAVTLQDILTQNSSFLDELCRRLDLHRKYPFRLYEVFREAKVRIMFDDFGRDDGATLYALGTRYLSGRVDGFQRDDDKALSLFRRAADKGFAPALCALGNCFLNGSSGVEQNEEAAAQLFLRAANLGDADGQVSLASCFFSGIGVTKSFPESLRYCALSAQQGNALALYFLGQWYYVGFGHIVQDVNVAYGLLRDSANNGYADAQVFVARCYDVGLHGVAKDSSEAFRYLRLAADQGLAETQYRVGVRLEEGNGTEPNLEEAMRYYRMAADNKNVDALDTLWQSYQNGVRGLRFDTKKMSHYLLRAVAQGSARAQTTLGCAHQQGAYGFAQHPAKAVYFFLLAARQHYAPAQFHLGNCYKDGFGGLVQDSVLAMRHYVLAAAQGFTEAHCTLGDLYWAGGLVVQNHAQAISHFRVAASQASAVAQCKLAYIYEVGSPWGCIRANMKLAVEYYHLSADQGNCGHAQYRLAHLYEDGTLVSEGTKNATYYYHLAADQGQLSAAQNNLGVYYDMGLRVPQDRVRAVSYYRQAADLGDWGALYNLSHCYRHGRLDVVQDTVEADRLWQLCQEKKREGGGGERAALSYAGLIHYR